MAGLYSTCMTRFNPSPDNALQLPNYSQNLIPYVSACQEDPEVRSFDNSLQQRTIKLFSSLVSTENSSLDSLVVVCEFLGDQSQDVVKVLIDNKEDVSNNEELKSLVDLFFESTNWTLDLFNTVENCVSQAENSQLLIRVAIQRFQTESMSTDVGGNNRYAVTLEELNRVIAMGDPFAGEFATRYEAVYKEQVKLLEKFSVLQVKLDNNPSNGYKLRTLGTLLFVAALISNFGLSMYLFPVLRATMMASVATTSTATAGTWVNSMLGKYYKALTQRQKSLSTLTENRTKFNIEAVKTIKKLVDILIIRMSSILKTVEVAMEKREEEAVKLAMQEIIDKVEGFAEKIKQVGVHVAECTELVVSGRVLVLKQSSQFH